MEDYDYDLLGALPNDEEVKYYTKNLDYDTISQLKQIFYDRYFKHENLCLKDSFNCTYIYWKAMVDLTEHSYTDIKKAYYNMYFNIEESLDYT
jgi:hypothetical protein